MEKKFSRLEIMTGKNLKGTRIKPKDLPKDIIELEHRQKILDEKRTCERQIRRDFKNSLIIVTILVLFACLLMSADEIDTGGPLVVLVLVAIYAISIWLAGTLLLSIPKRIYNYKNYNFERTCYATLSNKFTHTTKDDNNRSSTNYLANLQINEFKYIKDVNISGSGKFFRVSEGEKVVVVSFDGYNAYLVNIN